MPQTYSVQYELNDEIAARAADALTHMPAHQFDAKFWKGLVSLVVLTVIGGLMVLLGEFMDFEWWLKLPLYAFLGVFGGLLVLLLSLHFFAWCITCILPLARWNIRRSMLKPFRDLGDRTVRWVFTDEQFETHTVNKDREVPWSSLKRVRLLPGFWGLATKKGPTLLLPEEHLSADIQNLIRRKAQEVGAKVSGKR
jgi:hypothetical protein